MSRVGRFFPVLLFIVLIIGGSLFSVFFLIRPRSIIRNCEFRLVSVDVLSHNDSTVVFRFSVFVSNPDFQAAQLEPLSFEIIPVGLDGPLAEGWSERSYTIPPHGSSVIDLFLRVEDSANLSSFIGNYLTTGRSELTILGFMRLTSLIPWKIPFSLNHVLEETGGALKEIVRLATIEGIPPGNRFNATLILTNPTSIPLNVSSLTFSVTNSSSHHLLKGVLTSPVRFPSSDSVNISAIIDVEKGGFEWLLGQIISNDTARLVVDGGVSAELHGLKLGFNYSRPFEFFFPTKQVILNRSKFASKVFGSLKRGPDYAYFEVPFGFITPIDCNLSSLNFELYNETASYIGFGYTSFTEPIPLTKQRWTQVPISTNLTMPAFNRIMIQFLLGENIDLELKNGVFSISIFQTEYNVPFDRRLQISTD